MIHQIAEIDKCLRDIKEKLNLDSSTQRLIVSANEECSLDSIASVITISIWLNKAFKEPVLAIPFCCINRKDFPLRTDITYWLSQCEVDWHYLFFLDDLYKISCVEFLTPVKVMLVGGASIPAPICHLELFGLVNNSIDAGMKNKSCVTSSSELSLCEIESCNSVSSIVFNLVTKNVNSLPAKYTTLLLGALLLTTECLKYASDYDKKVFDSIFAMKSDEVDVKNVYESLLNAKFDIAGLTLFDAMRRNLQIISCPDKTRRIILSRVTGVDVIDALANDTLGYDACQLCLLQKSLCVVAISEMHDRMHNLVVWTFATSLFPMRQLVATLKLRLQLQCLEESWHSSVYSARIVDCKNEKISFTKALTDFLSSGEVTWDHSSFKENFVCPKQNSRESTFISSMITFDKLMRDGIVSKISLENLKKYFYSSSSSCTSYMFADEDLVAIIRKMIKLELNLRLKDASLQPNLHSMNNSRDRFAHMRASLSQPIRSTPHIAKMHLMKIRGPRTMSFCHSRDKLEESAAYLSEANYMTAFAGTSQAIASPSCMETMPEAASFSLYRRISNTPLKDVR